MSRPQLASCPFFLIWFLTACGPVPDSPAMPGSGSVGFSTVGIDALNAGLQGLVDEGRVAGLVTMLARHGAIVQSEVFGYQDLDGSVSMETDTIFRIYSMSKPITGVAMMILHDRGLWALDDPVSNFIPEFDGLQVTEEAANGEIRLVPQDHSMTMRELMTHTGGLTYGLFGESAVDEMYWEANVLDEDSSLQAMIDKLAEIPLQQQPGSLWHYSVSTDVQGYIVEKLSGQTLPEFLTDEIFGPLGMDDTGFYVPAAKADRLALTVSRYDPEGDLVRAPGLEGNYHELPGLASGGGGLVSTIADYMRFAQMLLSDGELDGVRVLSTEAVKLLRNDQAPTTEANGVVQLPPGSGFGLNVAIFSDPSSSGSVVGKDTYWWAGAAGTWFWIDPVNDLIFIGMAQNDFFNIEDFLGKTQRWTYDALIDPAL